MASLLFDPTPVTQRHGIVVSFDLSGFSDFCNQADAHVTIPRFISGLFDELDRFTMNALQTFLFGVSHKRIPAPRFIKYTGDGAILIWEAPNGKFEEAFCTALVAAMRALQQQIVSSLPKWEEEWRVSRLPKAARFGIASGLVYPLKARSETLLDGEVIDYVGYCINLAVRLQNHCPELGFLVHNPVHPKLPGMTKLNALRMKGVRDEPVLAFDEDLQRISSGIFEQKFSHR